MIHEQFLRTQMLLGTEALERFQQARVAVFGIGGVGGYTVEALARSGIGQLDLIDNDTISISNINRQILATHSTVGQPKVEAARKRILDINPGCIVRTHQVFYTPETADQFDFTHYDYIVDAIDTVTGKLQLVQRAVEACDCINRCVVALCAGYHRLGDSDHVAVAHFITFTLGSFQNAVYHDLCQIVALTDDGAANASGNCSNFSLHK